LSVPCEILADYKGSVILADCKGSVVVEW